MGPMDIKIYHIKVSAVEWKKQHKNMSFQTIVLRETKFWKLIRCCTIPHLICPTQVTKVLRDRLRLQRVTAWLKFPPREICYACKGALNSMGIRNTIVKCCKIEFHHQCTNILVPLREPWVGLDCCVYGEGCVGGQFGYTTVA